MTSERFNAFDEILDFITSGPTLEQIIDFAPSEKTSKRVHYLLEAQDNGTLSPDEKAELEEFARADHFMEMLKVRARRRLDGVEDTP